MGCLRAFLSLNTVIAAYIYRTDNTVIAYWIVFASITTAWAWFVDVRFDWGMLTYTDKCHIVRPKVVMPNARWVYYLMMVMNLAMRLAWVLTISP